MGNYYRPDLGYQGELCGNQLHDGGGGRCNRSATHVVRVEYLVRATPHGDEQWMSSPIGEHVLCRGCAERFRVGEAPTEDATGGIIGSRLTVLVRCHIRQGKG